MVIWGGLLMLLLPNDILSAKRFTVEEKILLIGRGKQNQTVGIPIINVILAFLTWIGQLEPLHQVVSDS